MQCDVVLGWGGVGWVVWCGLVLGGRVQCDVVFCGLVCYGVESLWLRGKGNKLCCITFQTTYSSICPAVRSCLHVWPRGIWSAGIWRHEELQQSYRCRGTMDGVII